MSIYGYDCDACGCVHSGNCVPALETELVALKAELTKLQAVFSYDEYGTAIARAVQAESEVATLKSENSRMREALGAIGIKALQAQYAVEAGGANEKLTEAVDRLAEVRNLSLFPQDAALSAPQEKPCQDCVGPDHPVCHEPDHQKPAQSGEA